MRFGISNKSTHLSFLFLLLLISGGDAESSKCSIDKVNKVIDEKFRGIKNGKIMYKAQFPKTSEVSICLGIDYDKADEENFAEMRKLIHGEDYCDNIMENGGTCKAIDATFNSYVALKEMGCVPVFRNYFPAWKTTDYDSVACETGSYDVDSKSFVKGKENGCNGFGLCDTLRMVLSISANQRRDNDCGPTAALTVLSNSNPVKALKVATQLAWTGQTEILKKKNQPCKYIYDQQPGVEYIPSKNTTLDEFCGPESTRPGGCESNYNQATASPKNKPYFISAPGLEYMWAQSMLTSHLRAFNDDGCVPEGLQLINANMSNSMEVFEYQEVYLNAAYYWCDAIIENESAECQIVMNLKHKKPATMTDSAFTYWASGSYTNAITNVQIDNYGGKGVKDYTGGALDYFEGVTCSLDAGTQSSVDSVMEFYENSSSLQPQITESMLNDACKKTESADHGVMVTINGYMLEDYFSSDRKTPPIPQKCVKGTEPYCGGTKDGLYPGCNHFVVLLRCDIPNNNYTIWTWAAEAHLTKEVLVADPDTGFGGSICSMVYAGPKTDSYVAPASEPYPCKSEPTSGAAGRGRGSFLSSPSWMLPFVTLVASISSLCCAVL